MQRSTAVAEAFGWCVRFRGRATRYEFWLVFLGFLAVNAIAAGTENPPMLILGLVVLVPLVAVGVRRLHDTGRRGTWWWLAVFLWGRPVLAVFLANRSQPQANQYGPPSAWGSGRIGAERKTESSMEEGTTV